MRPSNVEFSSSIKDLALVRQAYLCALCGEDIKKLGKDGRFAHRYGEIAHAHHILHVKLGGGNNLSNCVILCQSCHYSVHEGGKYRTGMIVGTRKDFPYFLGKN